MTATGTTSGSTLYLHVVTAPVERPKQTLLAISHTTSLKMFALRHNRTIPSIKGATKGDLEA